MNPGNESEANSAHNESIDYEPLENTVDDAQDILGEVEVAERFEPDKGDLETRLEEVEDAVDNAQDNEDVTIMSSVPAQVNYLQAAARNLADQVDDGSDLQRFGTAVEGIQDALSDFTIERSRWFALVNGRPLIFNEQIVDANELIRGALDDVDPSDYTLEGYTSPADDDPEVQYARPEQDVDLRDYHVYRTARDKGGGPV